MKEIGHQQFCIRSKALELAEKWPITGICCWSLILMPLPMFMLGFMDQAPISDLIN